SRWLAATRQLPSFPTRRSSDLARVARAAPMGGDDFGLLFCGDQVRPLFFASSFSSSVWLFETAAVWRSRSPLATAWTRGRAALRSEEHTSELQSRENLVCRLLL